MGEFYQRRAFVIVDSLKVDKLRVTFAVRKTLKPEPNTAEIRIYNLAETTRGAMQRAGAKVILSAGYETSEAVIFSGDARLIDHTRSGPDWITRIVCGDGERAYQFARFSKSFGPGTPIVDVIKAAAKSLGLGLGNLDEQLKAGGFKGGLSQFSHGYTAAGKARDELDRLLASVGLAWSVQDGALQVLKGGAAATGSAVLLSPDTGLIGSPDHGTPEVKGAPPPVRARSYLQPQIRCGGRVEIRAAGVKGQFRVGKIEHRGDTHGPDWFTDLEGQAVS